MKQNDLDKKVIRGGDKKGQQELVSLLFRYNYNCSKFYTLNIEVVDMKFKRLLIFY